MAFQEFAVWRERWRSTSSRRFDVSRKQEVHTSLFRPRRTTFLSSVFTQGETARRQERALVTGVANRWSIATGIARKLHEHGAQIALHLSRRTRRDEVEKLAAELGGGPVFECDVTNDESLAAMREASAENSVEIDFAVPRDRVRQQGGS